MRAYIGIILFICSINSSQVFAKYHLKDESVDSNKVHFNGIYSEYNQDIERGVIIHCIAFLSNQRIYLSSGRAPDSLLFKRDFYKSYVQSTQIGYYTIIDDTIYAEIPTSFYLAGQRTKGFIAKYKGHIKNKDTIANWKMIPPYPEKAKAKFNNNFILQTKPRTLFFIKNEAILYLDSLMR